MEKLLNVLWFCGLIFGITACSGDNETNEVVRERVSCSSGINVNLPSTSNVLDPLLFTPSEASTFNSSVTLTFFDIFGKSYLLSSYFIKSNEEEITWNVYFYLDGLPIDIASGVAGNQGQFGAQLSFDESGQLLSTSPTVIVSEELILRDDLYTHSIKFNFTEFYTTQFDAPFSASVSVNSCYLDN